MCANTSTGLNRPAKHLDLPRLVLLDAALRDLAEIAGYIERESQSREVAEAFVDKLIGYCERLAILPGLMGRPRPELRPDYRSVTFGNYVIFLRYVDESEPRSVLQTVRVLHGSRDLDAYFASYTEDDSNT